MSQAYTEHDPVPWADFEDIESELLCSDREVTVGAFPALDRQSREAVIRLAGSHRWTGRAARSGNR